MSSQYVFLQNVDEEERKRLSHFEAYLDGYTAQRLERIGIGAGWNCLEVGAGRGSVAKMLSSRVGASGSVLAADIDLRFLAGLPRNVEVRRHDIEAEDLGRSLYDLVHCRAMLMWLRQPARALQRMMLALKPGGWLLAEELDWGFCTVGGHPDAGWATEYVHELFERHEAAGIRHPYFGRTLAAFVAEAGFADLSGELAATIGLEGSAALEVISLTVRALRAPSLALKESAADLDRLDAALANPRAIVVGITSIGVQARKP